MTARRADRPRRGLALLGVLVAAGAVALIAPAPASAAQDPGAADRRVVNIEKRTVNIVRRVESISGDVRTQETPEQVEVTLAADVLFAFDSADLSPEAAARIAEVAKQVQADAKGPVAIVGHTDAKGTDAYNADLSLRRAQSVEDALAAKAPGATFTVAGKGASEPVAPNTKDDGSDDPDGRARNRRVTITFARQT